MSVPTAVLSVRHSPDGLAGRAPLRVDWRVTPAAGVQEAYELQSASDSSFATVAATTGVIESDAQLDVEAPGAALTSREERALRVRVRVDGIWSDWSEPVSVEAGLLSAQDWQAVAVALPGYAGEQETIPVPLLRTELELPAAPVRARLYATSYGLHELRLNGHVVGDRLLEPGWTAYQDRLLLAVHDVTDLLVAGPNVLGARLGDGWYRGRLGWSPGKDRCKYGDRLALLAQLEVECADGSRVVVGTGPDWRGSTGEVLAADLYDGCTTDLRKAQTGWDATGFDASAWAPLDLVELDPARITPRVAPPVRVVDRITPHLGSRRPDGTDGAQVVTLDAGQNVAGFVRLTVRGRAGDTVVVRHAEVLEADGALHTLSLRSAQATDTYTLADDGEVVLEPVFTFHGFRFGEVATSAEVVAAEVVVITSDTPRRGWFSSSHPQLDRFHENVVWSQRDNFVSVPTDCPQRDERLGWTGDAQAFAPTACTLFDARSFWSSWLVDLAIDQKRTGAVGSVVPDILYNAEFDGGRTGWADAGTIVPWAVHEAYDDRELLARQLESMAGVVSYLLPKRGEDGLCGGEFQFGDWLDPDAPGDQPWKAKCDSDYLTNAYLSYSARLVARAARLLGRDDLAAQHEELAEEVAALTWKRWADHAVTTQTGCAVALQLGIAPDGERAAVGAALARQVREADGRIATGFLGTPLVLPALTATGHLAEAYLMLLRREMPSWLYQVDRGATTVWERWDAIRPDGSIHDGVMHMPDGDGHMLSFNHYAYGAVVDWVYRTLAGLAPDVDRPGYRHVVLAPRPVRGIDHAQARVDSSLGSVTAAWVLEQRDGQELLSARYGVPFGATATFDPPLTDGSRVTVDGAAVAAGPVTLGPGEHVVEVTAPGVVDPAVAS